MSEIPRYWRLKEAYKGFRGKKVDVKNPGVFVLFGGAGGDRIFIQENGKLEIPPPEKVHEARVKILFQAK